MRAACLLFAVAACAREPLENCPVLAEGDLVVTEIASDDDAANGQWLELFNASGAALDLEGLRLRFRTLDGASEERVIVRRSLPVGAGEYVVLGRFFDEGRPDHVDYGFIADYNRAWLGAAAVQIEACTQEVDLAQYSALPETGTFSLGTMPPDYESNDLATSWCFDPTPTGTPGAANTPCP